jgi:hypothetical protein
VEINNNHDQSGEAGENPLNNFETLLGEYLANPNANPVDFALQLVERGATQSDYEKLIPALDREILPLTPLIENYRLMMRGDSVERVENRILRFDSVVGMNMIRSREMDMSGKDKNLFILGSIMDEIIHCYNRANNYRDLNISNNEQRLKPVLIYSFSKYPQNDSLEAAKARAVSNQSLFYGHTDDLGVNVANNYFLEFPQDSSQEIIDKLLPNVFSSPSFDVSTQHSNRHENLIRQFIDPENQADSSNLQPYTIIPKTYFNLELVTHRILKDLQTYSLENP